MSLPTILLIGVLFNPATGQYGEFMLPFASMQECQAKRTEMRRTVPKQAGLHFVLECVQTKPTDGVEV